MSNEKLEKKETSLNSKNNTLYIIFGVVIFLGIIIYFIFNHKSEIKKEKIVVVPIKKEVKIIEKKVDINNDKDIIIRKNGIVELKPGNIEIVKMDHIIRFSTKKSDLQYCKKLKYSMLQSTCISRVKFKLKLP